MLLVGLTGGIGSGKSVVGNMLSVRGALVIDADELARRAVDPGTPGLTRIVEAFGPEVLGPHGELDREEMARRAFQDPEARGVLESIVHPEVVRLLAEAVAPLRDTDRVVVCVVPLLVEADLGSTFDVVVAVSADPQVRAARLGRDRGMTEEAVRERMAAQASENERQGAADFVVANEGTLEELEGRVETLWRDLSLRAAGGS